MLAKITEKIKSPNGIYILLSVAVTVIFSQIRIFNDDNLWRNEVGLKSAWEYIIRFGEYHFYNWSSRFIINPLSIFFIVHNKYFFALLMGAAVFLICRCVSGWTDSRGYGRELVIAVVIMAYPFTLLTSAGWIFSSVTYYVPMAMALFGCFAIRDVYENRDTKIYINLIYIICILVAANLEQIMAELLVVYTVLIAYFFAEKNVHIKKMTVVLIQYVIIIISAAYTVFSPGNNTRKVRETGYYFKDFNELNLFNKMDMGFFSTMREIIINQSLIFLLLMIILLILVWNKTESRLKRVMAVWPAVIVLYFVDPVRQLIDGIYPYLSYIPTNVAKHGIFKEGISQYGIFVSIAQMGIYLFFMADIFLMVYWVSNNWYEKLFSISFLAGGLGSRVVMGLSPTIYASGSRTFSIMILSVMFVVLYSLMNNYDALSKRSKNAMLYGAVTILPFAILNLIRLVAVSGS